MTNLANIGKELIKEGKASKRGKKTSGQRELLFSVTKDDFDVTWFSGTGAGGQYRNKHQNCCRIIHRETGSIGTGQSQRDRKSNQKEAFMNCVTSPKFQAWMRMRIAEAVGGESIDELVEKALTAENVKVEYRENGKWLVDTTAFPKGMEI